MKCKLGPEYTTDVKKSLLSENLGFWRQNRRTEQDVQKNREGRKENI